MIDRAAFAKDRVVRVFVSSTFADMHPERDELVKRVFPQLRRMCVERGVSWSEVDLRWGISEEQSERGEVLPICLAEIERCPPVLHRSIGRALLRLRARTSPIVARRDVNAMRLALTAIFQESERPGREHMIRESH